MQALSQIMTIGQQTFYGLILKCICYLSKIANAFLLCMILRPSRVGGQPRDFGYIVGEVWG
jgi:hypothetical protein